MSQQPHPSRNGQYVNFLDRFGQDDRDRTKVRAQMAQDYEEYKRASDAKFRNRFADKKMTDGPQAQQPHEHLSGPINPLPTYVPVVHETAQDVTSGQAMQSEFQRIEAHIESKLEDLSRKMESIRANNDVPPTMLRPTVRYERELQSRLNVLKDAENKLISLEQQYNSVLTSPDTNFPKPPVPMTYRTTSIHPPNALANYGQFGQEGLDAGKSKFENQQRYRQELENQIVDMRQRRLADAAKDREMDRTEMKPTPFGSRTEPAIRLPEMGSLNKSTNLVNMTSYNTPGAVEYFASGNTDLLNGSMQHQLPGTLLTGSNTLPPLVDMDRFDVGSMNRTPAGDQDLKKARYAEELRQQIEDTKRKKALQRQREEEHDRRLEAEFIKHNSTLSSEHESSQPTDVRVVRGQPAIGADPPTEQSPFARGGHGIFGSPLTTEQKNTHQRYKEDLAIQIAEKKRHNEEMRRKEEEDDLRESERVKEEQLRMQREFDTEKARTLAKAREAEELAEMQRIADDKQQQQQKHLHHQEQLQRIDETPSRPPTRVVRPIKSRDEPRVVTAKKPGTATLRERSDSQCSLLIGPDLTTQNFHKHQLESMPPREVRMIETQNSSVIGQLQTLRSQLESERERIEESLTRHDRLDKCRHDILPAQHSPNCTMAAGDCGRYHPRVVRKGASLFQSTDHRLSSNDEPRYGIGVLRKLTPIRDWPERDENESRVNRLDKQQVAYLRAQDEYLNELKDNIDILSVRELLNDTELRRVETGLAMNPVESLPPMRTPQETINCAELEERNQQRLKRLEAMQLLNDIDTDPEAVLQRFMTKHDSVFAK